MTEEKKAHKRAYAKQRYHEQMDALDDEGLALLKKKRRAYYMKHRKEIIGYQLARRNGGKPHELEKSLAVLAESIRSLKAMVPRFAYMLSLKKGIEFLIKQMELAAARRKKRLNKVNSARPLPPSSTGKEEESPSA